jgi:hypothetical protein
MIDEYSVFSCSSIYKGKTTTSFPRELQLRSLHFESDCGTGSVTPEVFRKMKNKKGIFNLEFNGKITIKQC